MARFTASTSSAPTATAHCSSPAPTPMKAAAGTVVTEMATPTAKLARDSKASMPATPAARATPTVAMLTVASSPTCPLRMSVAGDTTSKRRSAVVSTKDVTTTSPRPGPMVPRAWPSSRGRRETMATHAADIGSRSGLTAMAPTMSTELLPSTPNAAITPATAM